MKDLQEDDLLVELTPEEQEEVQGGLSVLDLNNIVFKRPGAIGIPVDEFQFNHLKDLANSGILR